MLPLRCPDWMSALPEELWDVPLTELAIPGTSMSLEPRRNPERVEKHRETRF